MIRNIFDALWYVVIGYFLRLDVSQQRWWRVGVDIGLIVLIIALSEVERRHKATHAK